MTKLYINILILVLGQTLYGASLFDQVQKNIAHIVHTQLRTTANSSDDARLLYEQYNILRQGSENPTVHDKILYNQIYEWTKGSINAETDPLVSESSKTRMMCGITLYLLDGILAGLDNSDALVKV